MNEDRKGSTGGMPAGAYSPLEASYEPTTSRETKTGVAIDEGDTVRVFVVAKSVTLPYDTEEAAARRIIRRINNM